MGWNEQLTKYQKLQVIMLNKTILGELTTVKCGAILSITSVNVALLVCPVIPLSGNVKSQSHWVRNWSLDNFKLLRLDAQQHH